MVSRWMFRNHHMSVSRRFTITRCRASLARWANDGCADGARENRRAMKDLIEKIIGYMPQYATDFGRLLLSPNDFIGQRNSDSDQDFANALLFVALSLCLATIMSSPTQAGDVWTSLARMGTLQFLALILTAIALRISWFLVGGTATVRRFVTSYAYISGVFIVIMTTVQLFGAGVFKVLDPELFQQIREADLHSRPLTTNPWDSSGYIASLVILFFGYLTLFAWSLGTWKVFEEMNKLTFGRSAAAFIIFSALGWLNAAVVFFFASALKAS
jgi:hypothetical protein